MKLALFGAGIALFLLTSCTNNSTSPFPLSVSGEKATYASVMDPDEKIKLAKKRKSQMVGIRKGDYYSLRNAPEDALRYYLEVAERLPDDQVVRKKIAHVYFLQKQWKQSYDNYVKVPLSELNDSEQNELFSALFFDENELDRVGELGKLVIGTGAQEYYHTIDTCYTGIHNCVIQIELYTGSYASLMELASVSKNASKISPDYQYRNFAIAAKLYEQGMYRAVEKLTREILDSRPDYFEVIKLRATALFSLGEYDASKKLFLQYIEHDPKDLESMVFLGEIHFFLKDYITSNLYLNNAILAGYTPKTDLERRLAYNYSLLSDTNSLMKVMNYLLQEPDVLEDDVAVGVSTALSLGENTRAQTWAEQGLQIYSGSNMIRPLYITSLRLNGDRDRAIQVLSNVSETDRKKNPNYELEEAILDFDMAKIDESLALFEELSHLEEWPDIVAEANDYIERIHTLQQAQSSGSSVFPW
ncbi:MAG: hypothetical protein HHAS10_07260 [Candidatus Altimarinota bacterium]